MPRIRKRCENTVSPRTVISSVSEKSFSFAVKKKQESIGKRETPYSIRFEITSFHSGREKANG